MPSNTSLYFPRPVCRTLESQFAFGHTVWPDVSMGAQTDLPDNLVVLQDTPTCCARMLARGRYSCTPKRAAVATQLGWQVGHTDVDAVVVPVCPRHVLVDVRVYPRHVDRWASLSTYSLGGRQVGDEAAVVWRVGRWANDGCEAEQQYSERDSSEGGMSLSFKLVPVPWFIRVRGGYCRRGGFPNRRSRPRGNRQGWRPLSPNGRPRPCQCHVLCDCESQDIGGLAVSMGQVERFAKHH